MILDLPAAAGPLSIEFIVDTAFDGELKLPTSILAKLDVRYVGPSIRALGNGTLRNVSVYLLEMEWNREPRTVSILCMEHRPLLGTALLDGWRLEVELSEGGEVQLEPPD